MLKCEVKVAKIFKLEILTTVKSLRVKDYQRLIAQAFDEEGNVFSSLEGLRFRWQVVSGSEAISLPKLKDSLVSVSETRRDLETRGYQSDIVIVEGKATGTARISLKIEEPGYEHIPTTTIEIHVSEPFAIAPSTGIWVPTHSHIKYRLFKIYDSIYKEIYLPSTSYTWRTSQPDLMEITAGGELFTFNKAGKGDVIAQDAVISSNKLDCEVNVVVPDRVLVHIEPYAEPIAVASSYTAEEYLSLIDMPTPNPSNWYLISGNKYTISLHLFYRDRQVFVPRNAQFSVSFANSDLWEIVSVSETSDRMVVIPRLPKNYSHNTFNTSVSGSLLKLKSAHAKVKDWTPSPTVSDVQEAVIVKPVKILEAKRPILLPYLAVLVVQDKSGRNAQEFRVAVEGGSGLLRWESSNSGIASVSAKGSVFGHRLGKTVVTVFDGNNNLNRDSVEVEVALIDHLVWDNPRQDIVAKSEGSASIIAYSQDNRTFHNCTSISLDWEISKGIDYVHVGRSKIVSDNKRERGVCEVRILEAFKEGQAVLSANLFTRPAEIAPDQPEIRLTSGESKVGVFRPLSIEWNEDVLIEDSHTTKTTIGEKQAVVLAPGSSARFLLKGGPLMWDDLPYYYNEKVEMSWSSDLKVNINKKSDTKDMRTISISCPTGSYSKDYEATVIVYNEKSDLLKKPGHSTLTLSVGCQLPATMNLDWILDPPLLADLSYKALPVLTDKYNKALTSKFTGNFWALLSDQDLKLNVTLWDAKERNIYNFESVDLRWSTDNKTIIDYTPSKSPYYQKTVRIQDLEGPVVLSASIDSLKDNTRLGLKVRSDLDCQVVSNVRVDPSDYSLYMHRHNSLELNILYGSGLFDVRCNCTYISDMRYDGFRKIVLNPKRLGRVLITVEDLALKGSSLAYSSVLISGLGNIELKEGGLIQVNNTQKLSMRVHDVEGNLFNNKEYSWMGLNLNLGVGSPFEVVSRNLAGSEYEIKAVSIGEFPIFGYGFREILDTEEAKSPIRNSNSITLDVFSPLELVPNHVMLLPGSKYTLSYIGGPEPHKYSTYGIDLRWKASNTEIATIDPSYGLISADKEGESFIILQMLRKGAVLTEASAQVVVKLANGVKIYGMDPGRSVMIESVTRLIAILMHNNIPFTDASADINYSWSSTSPSVYRIYKENEAEGKQIGVTGLAVGAGRSDISLTVDIKYPSEYKSKENVFSSKITVSVEQVLVAHTPSHRCHAHSDYDCSEEFDRWRDSTLLLMPPHAVFQVRLNKEAALSIKCEMCRDDLLKLRENGRLQSFNQKGEASILIQNAKARGDYHIVNVVITEIHSIFVHDSNLAINMALGAEIKLNITYQDTMGRSFPDGFEQGVDTVLEVSNTRVLQASLEHRNTVLRIRSQYVGSSIVKVYLQSNPEIKDVFEVHVSSVMRPIAPVILHLGGEVQFQPTHTPSLATGTWSVDNPSILTVSDKGYAKSLSEGETYVHYVEKSLDLKSLVQVMKVKGIGLGADAPTIVSNYEKNAYYRERYVIPVKLYLDAEKKKSVPVLPEEDRKLIKQNIHVICSTPHYEWFDVETLVQDLNFSCIVRPLKYPTGGTITGKEFKLMVSASSEGRSLYSYEEVLSIPMIPRFNIVGDSQVVLSTKTLTQNVIVGGSCSNLQTNSESAYVTAQLLQEGNRCLLKVETRTIDADFKLKKVEIVDRETGQREQIFVNFYTDPTKAEPGQIMTLHDFFVVVAIMFLLYVLYFYVKGSQRSEISRPYGPYRQPSSVPRPSMQGQSRNYGPNLGVSPPTAPIGTPSSAGYKNIAYNPSFR